MDSPTSAQLRKLVGIGNYQFGHYVGEALFNKKVQIQCSRKTGRIRYIYNQGRLIATLRPKDGCLALTPYGASLILSKIDKPPNTVAVQNDVSEAVRSGGDAFAKHVVRADPELRPADETIVTDQNGSLLGVGRAILSGPEMTNFKRGIAVKLRRGVDEVDHGDNEDNEVL